jgi:hypothetical protein
VGHYETSEKMRANRKMGIKSEGQDVKRVKQPEKIKWTGYGGNLNGQTTCEELEIFLSDKIILFVLFDNRLRLLPLKIGSETI